MSAMKRCLLAVGVAMMMAQPSFSDEPWVSGFPGGEGDLKIGQLFKINTEGPMAADPDRALRETGTAFAITKTMLITARHVTRNAQEFANLAAGNNIFFPDRTVTYDFARDVSGDAATFPFNAASVTPAATPTIDASRLNLGNARATPFTLSVCAIEKDTEYYLLKFRDGNLNVPRIVPIKADVEAYTDHGEARQFTHSTTGLDRPKPGDSGAPVLDKKGHVVGLLSAIKDSESVLLVTMTRSFLDLVPSGVNVACADRINRGQVTQIETALREMIISATADYEERIEELEDSFEKETEKLQSHIDLLTERNKQLSERLSRATEAASMTIRVLKKIDAEGIFIDLDPEVHRRIIEELSEQRPVIPRVEQMFKDLGREDWQFGMQRSTTGFLTVTADYARTISLPRYAQTLWFCIRPLKMARSLEEQDELEGVRDVTSQKFYRATDKKLDGEDDMRCRPAEHPKAPNAERIKDDFDAASYPFKSGSYRFLFDATVPKDEDVPDFTGFYYGIMFVDNGTEKRDITHRFIFDVGSESDREVPECYVFENDDGRGDTFATFVQASAEEREATTRCRNS